MKDVCNQWALIPLFEKLYKQWKVLSDLRPPTTEKARVKEDQRDISECMGGDYLLFNLTLSFSLFSTSVYLSTSHFIVQ